jgi:hypothetical protein
MESDQSIEEDPLDSAPPRDPQEHGMPVPGVAHSISSAESTVSSYEADLDLNTSLSSDTPETAKIRRLIDEELNRRLAQNPRTPTPSFSSPGVDPLSKSKASAEVQPSRDESDFVAAGKKGLSLPLHVSVEVAERPAVDAPGLSKKSSVVPSKNAEDHLRGSVSAIGGGGVNSAVARALAAAAARRDALVGSARRFPGRQKQFVDDETERVSRIMLGTIQRNLT